jgi:hypothetical protein
MRGIVLKEAIGMAVRPRNPRAVSAREAPRLAFRAGRFKRGQQDLEGRFTSAAIGRTLRPHDIHKMLWSVSSS